jgi:hypothetical protein
MNVESIIETIETKHGGAYWALFHSTEDGHRFLPSGDVLTPAQYAWVVRTFASPKIEKVGDLSPEERKINERRAKAVARGGGHD